MTQAATAVGGLPLFWCGTVADPTDAAYTFTTPTGFYPDFVMVVQATTTTPTISYWCKSINANPGAILCADDIDGGAFNINTYSTSDGITVAAGIIIVGTDVADDNVATTVLAWRYSA